MNFEGNELAPSFSEMHLKMSKKIAQLTKVIFHLNTKNEDAHLESAYRKELYGLEISRYAEDALEKMSSLQEQYQFDRGVMQSEISRSKIQNQKLQEEIKRARLAATSRQTEMENEFSKCIASLETQIEQKAMRFLRQTQEIEERMEAEREKWQMEMLDASKKWEEKMTHAIAALKSAHADEVEQLVIKSNGKYNHMLYEQLGAQDALKEQLMKQEMEWRVLKEEMQQQAALAQGELLRKRKGREKELEDSAQAVKRDLLTKIEGLLVENESLRQNEMNLRSDKEMLLRQCSEGQGRLSQYELEAKNLRIEIESMEKDRLEQDKIHQANARLSATRMEELETEMYKLQSLNLDKDRSLQQADSNFIAIQKQMSEANAKFADSEVQLTRKLRERDAECSDLTKTVKHLQESLSQETESAGKTAEGFEKTLKKLHHDNLQLIKQIDELKAQILQAEKDAHELTEENGKRLSSLEKQVIENLAKAKEEKALFRKSMDAQQKEFEKRTEDMRDKNQIAHTNMLRELKETHDKELQARDARLEELAAKLRAQEKDWMSKYETQKRCFDQETSASSDKLKEIEKRVNLLSSQLATSKIETEHYKKKIEVLQASEAKLTDVIGRLQDELKLQNTENASNAYDLKVCEEELATLRQSLAQRIKVGESLEIRLADAKAACEQEILLLQCRLHTLQSELEDTQKTASSEIQRLIEQRVMDQEHNASAMASLKSRTEKQIQKAEQKAQADRDCLVKEHEHILHNALEEKQKIYILQQENVIHDLCSQHARALDESAAQSLRELENLRINLKDQKLYELMAVKNELTEAFQKRVEATNQDNQQKLAQIADKHAATILNHEESHKALMQQFDIKCDALKASHAHAESLMIKMNDAEIDMRKKLLLKDKGHADQIAQLQSSAKREIDQMLEEHFHETKMIHDQFASAKTAMTDAIDRLQYDLKEWKAKYMNRESREEDVERITYLEQLVRQKDALVRRTLDEMAYFKREMLNREEMYNKTFSRTPNVGIMQVLKPHLQLQQQYAQKSSPFDSSGLLPKTLRKRGKHKEVAVPQPNNTSEVMEEIGSQKRPNTMSNLYASCPDSTDMTTALPPIS